MYRSTLAAILLTAALLVYLPCPSRASAVSAAGFAGLPLSFEPNLGQSDPSVRFLARGPGYALFLTSSEAVLSVKGVVSPAVVRLRMAGAAGEPRAEGLDRLPGNSSYLTGSDPSRWRTGIPQYGRVRFAGVYPGIDLVYYGAQGRLEYDFLVAPGADPASIELEVDGAERLRVDGNGDLVLETRAGEVRQRRPLVYQEGDRGRTEVNGRFVLRGSRRAGFLVSRYDKSKPLNIDPVLTYSTYLGGSGGYSGGNDTGRAVAADPAGNVYVAGIAASSGLPVTAGAYQTAHRGGSTDAFVAKVSPGGALLYCTYLGGAGEDEAYGIAVDAGGNAYVTGRTTSSAFPVTQGAYQAKPAGYWDVFVSKLNPAGTALVYSTLLGGAAEDGAYGIAVDSPGNAYVVGKTSSSGFPVTPGVLQSGLRGGGDAFVTKIDQTGGSLVYSTYLGGSYDETGYAIAVDAGGKAVVGGQTLSSDFPLTPDAYRKTLTGNESFVSKLNETGSALVFSTFLGAGFVNAVALDNQELVYAAGYTSWRGLPITRGALVGAYAGGGADGFLVKLDNRGTSLLYGTFVGGSGNDRVNAVSVDPRGGIVLAGETDSRDLPVSAGAPQPAFGGGAADGFVLRLETTPYPAQAPYRARMSGTVLRYSTYFGGAGEDRLYGLALDRAGGVWTSGYSNSGNLPVTADAFQTSPARGGWDAVIARVRPEGTGLAYSSWLGGPGSSALSEEAFDVAADGQGSAYVTGRTFSSNFPVTPGAMQPAYAGDTGLSDAYVAKLDPSGRNLVYATFLGGRGEDIGWGIAVDGAGSAYVAGTTASTDFPTTTGAYRTTPSGQSPFVFVSKLRPDGTGFVYSTLLGSALLPLEGKAMDVAVDAAGNAFIGGSARPGYPTTPGSLQSASGSLFVTKLKADGSGLTYSALFGRQASYGISAVALDGAGNAFLAGSTDLRDFPTTQGALRGTYGGGRADGFVAKLNAAGSALLYSTYVGGVSDDLIYGLAVDSGGNAYVTGETASSDFPTTPDSFQPAVRFLGGFLAKVKPDGSGMAYVMWLPGTRSGTGVAVDASGNAYVAGIANAADLPVTNDAVQYTSGGLPDGFLLKFDPQGKSVLYGTYLGGSAEEKVAAVALDTSANVYVAGQTSSANFPVSGAAYQPTAAGPRSAFLTKAGFGATGPVPAITRVVNAVTDKSEVAPGSIIAIYGERLAKEALEAAKPLNQRTEALPLTLGGAVVRVKGAAAPLFSVSPEKIVAQLPYEATSQAPVSVELDGVSGNNVQVAVAAVAIGILAVYKQDMSPITAASPIRAGDTMLAFVTGAGGTQPQAASGVPVAPGANYNVVERPFTALRRVGSADNVICDIQSFTLAPGLVGVAQAVVKTRAGSGQEGKLEYDLFMLSRGVESNLFRVYMAPSPD